MEAATSRLEDITIYQEQQKASSQSASANPSLELVKGTPLENPKPVAPAASAVPPTAEKKYVEEESPIVVNFQQFLDKFVKPLETKSKELDSEIDQVVKYLVLGFNAEKQVLKLVSLSKPTSDLSEYIGPIQTEIQSVMDYKEKYRGKFVNHINAIAEFVAILGWIVIPCNGGKNKPMITYVNDINESTQFWSNRILKEFKDTNQTHVEWAKQLAAITTGLKEYIDENHTTGLAFNVSEGISIEEAAELLKTSDTSSQLAITKPEPVSGNASAPPPPPPPMPATSIYQDIEKEEPKETGLAAVFNSINQGTDITKGLRKVDKSEMTHKNPELRNSTGKPSVPPKPPKKPHNLASGKVPAKKAEPKKELIDTKWMVSDFEDNNEIVIEGEMSQSVFVGKCKNVTIKIVGKVNAITVSECSKIGILTDGMISGIDIIKTNKFQLQPLGLAPLINIDQSHDGEVYLNKDTLASQVYTSQATAINIYSADPEDDETDFKENPLPEQLVHTFDAKTGKFVSAVVDASL